MSLTIEDIVAIQQLVNRYTLAFDASDVDTVLGCFTADGSFSMAGHEVARGRAALADFVAASALPGQMRHVVTSVLVDGDGDGASVRAYGTVVQSVPGSGCSVLLHGVYRDRVLRDDTGWRFTHRSFDPDPT